VVFFRGKDQVRLNTYNNLVEVSRHWGSELLHGHENAWSMREITKKFNKPSLENDQSWGSLATEVSRLENKWCRQLTHSFPDGSTPREPSQQHPPPSRSLATIPDIRDTHEVVIIYGLFGPVRPPIVWLEADACQSPGEKRVFNSLATARSAVEGSWPLATDKLTGNMTCRQVSVPECIGSPGITTIG
jgi:hypothetical protein